MESQNNKHTSHYVTPGMPSLTQDRVTSFFEFWPTWLMYLPVVFQWLYLSAKYRSLTLPLIANPSLPLSGMVGVNKSTLLEQAKNELAEAILPWMIYQKNTESLSDQTLALYKQIQSNGFSFPVVCKPDIGCRGKGVKLINNIDELQNCLSFYPEQSNLMIQKLADYEPEAGVFYVRFPEQEKGEIVSMALKYMPYVIGDGNKTLKELVEEDDRAGKLIHLYESRHKQRWHNVIPTGNKVRLVFSASHCRGAIFKDANHLITPQLTEKLNHLMSQLPDFHYGRLDIKFKDLHALQAGEDLQIVEINCASSESLHIWDSDTDLKNAFKALLSQYQTLFKIGHSNRKRGHKSPGLRKLIEHWNLERRLTDHYPETD